jgi:hypothetical protein
METITRSDGKTLSAVVSSTNTDKPAVIIIQEWYVGMHRVAESAEQKLRPILNTFLTPLRVSRSIDHIHHVSYRWGINEQMKKRAKKFEEAGFRTILPDLYHGKVATKAQEAKHLFDSTITDGLIYHLHLPPLLVSSPQLQKTDKFVFGTLNLTPISSRLARGLPRPSCLC